MSCKTWVRGPNLLFFPKLSICYCVLHQRVSQCVMISYIKKYMIGNMFEKCFDTCQRSVQEVLLAGMFDTFVCVSDTSTTS